MTSVSKVLTSADSLREHQSSVCHFMLVHHYVAGQSNTWPLSSSSHNFSGGNFQNTPDAYKYVSTLLSQSIFFYLKARRKLKVSNKFIFSENLSHKIKLNKTCYILQLFLMFLWKLHFFKKWEYFSAKIVFELPGANSFRCDIMQKFDRAVVLLRQSISM